MGQQRDHVIDLRDHAPRDGVRAGRRSHAGRHPGRHAGRPDRAGHRARPRRRHLGRGHERRGLRRRRHPDGHRPARPGCGARPGPPGSSRSRPARSSRTCGSVAATCSPTTASATGSRPTCATSGSRTSRSPCTSWPPRSTTAEPVLLSRGRRAAPRCWPAPPSPGCSRRCRSTARCSTTAGWPPTSRCPRRSTSGRPRCSCCRRWPTRPLVRRAWLLLDRVFGRPAEAQEVPPHPGVEVHWLPAPPFTGNPYSFRESRRLIDEAHALTDAHLDRLERVTDDADAVGARPRTPSAPAGRAGSGVEGEEHHLGGVGHEAPVGRVPQGHLDRGVAVAGVAGPVVGEQPAGAGRAEQVDGEVRARDRTSCPRRGRSAGTPRPAWCRTARWRRSGRACRRRAAAGASSRYQ